MSVLKVAQDAALSLGLAYPSVVFSSTERTWQQMQATVNECARQILDAYDWSRLKKVATITGDGVLTSFPMPADYERMVKDANLWGPNLTFYPSQQVADFNEWLEMLSWSIESWQPRWSVFGGSLNVLPVMEDQSTLTYGYISKWVVNGTAEQFSSDSDNFILDERLLTLAVIWNWKKQQGQDYAGELAEYEEALDRQRWKDTGARQSIISGRYMRYPTGQVFP